MAVHGLTPRRDQDTVSVADDGAAPVGQRPLKVFLHIPKTAGSTVNAHLLRQLALRHSPRLWPAVARSLPDRVIDSAKGGRFLSRRLARGCSHVESCFSRPEVRDRILLECDWVSGHVPRPVMERHLARLGREAAYSVVVRDPTAQIASHYAWWIEIYRRGPWSYFQYRRPSRALSRRIRNGDNLDPRTVVSVLADNERLFLNLQARFLVGDLTAFSQDRAREILQSMESFGVDGDFAPVVSSIAGGGPSAGHHVNRSRSGLDRTVFYSPLVQGFLRERHAADIALYAAALELRDRAVPSPDSARMASRLPGEHGHIGGGLPRRPNTH